MKLPKRREILQNLAFKIGKTTFGQRVTLDLMNQFARSVDPDESMPSLLRTATAMKAFNESSNISLAGRIIKSALRVLFRKDAASRRCNTRQNDVPKGNAPAPL